MSLSGQIVMPGGATTHRLDEHLLRPAKEVLAAGDAPPAPGTQPLEILEVRPLSEGDAQVAVLRSMGDNVRSAVSWSGQIRVRHHAVARLLAAGRRKTEVCAIMEMSPSTLATLERSPAFQALVLEYMNMMDEKSVESYTRLKLVGNLGMDELTRRLTEAPTTIKTSEVLEIVKTAADRTGLGPTTKQVTLNGRISPAELRAIKAAPPIEAEYSEVDSEGRTADGGTVVGLYDAADAAAGGGIPAGTNAGQVASTEDVIEDFVTDLGSVLGRGR